MSNTANAIRCKINSSEVLWLSGFLHIAKIDTFKLQEIVEITVKLKQEVIRDKGLLNSDLMKSHATVI